MTADGDPPTSQTIARELARVRRLGVGLTAVSTALTIAALVLDLLLLAALFALCALYAALAARDTSTQLRGLLDRYPEARP